jgi:hypothetical protein
VQRHSSPNPACAQPLRGSIGLFGIEVPVVWNLQVRGW